MIELKATLDHSHESDTRHRTTPDFFDRAGEMRERIDEHFSSAHKHKAETHQIWNYWFVPGLYAYLRTDPDNIFGSELTNAFMDALRKWSLANLGYANITKPLLSLYVNGCGQGLHNDFGNGRWAYVFSLTKWDERKFHGGETMIFREDAYSWETNAIARPAAGEMLYEKIPGHFNQLLTFDDRCIHGVERVQGTMAPLEGRLVLHGHISAENQLAKSIKISGPLQVQDVFGPAAEAQRAILRLSIMQQAGCEGVIAVRASVASDGSVKRVELLSDCISRDTRTALSPKTLRDVVLEEASRMRFVSMEDSSEVTLTFVVS